MTTPHVRGAETSSPGNLCGFDQATPARTGLADENSLPPFGSIFHGLHDHLQLPALSQEFQLQSEFAPPLSLSQDEPPPPPLSLHNSPQVLASACLAPASAEWRKAVFQLGVKHMNDAHKCTDMEDAHKHVHDAHKCMHVAANMPMTEKVKMPKKAKTGPVVPNIRRRKNNFHDWQVEIMFELYKINKYPQEEMDTVAEQCKLTVAQVKMWFENMRKRLGHAKMHRKTRERMREEAKEVWDMRDAYQGR